MANVAGEALYAALAEHIYRRDDKNDQTIKLTDIDTSLSLFPVDKSQFDPSLNLDIDKK